MLDSRFWSKVKTSDIHSYEGTFCKEWTAYTNPDGYGRFKSNGIMKPTHRVAYEDKYGIIPEGLVINHLCRNRKCVNSENHLEAITQGENIRKGLTGKINHHNLKKTNCPQGHEYTEENTYVHSGKRNCKICGRIATRKYRKRLLS